MIRVAVALLATVVALGGCVGASCACAPAVVTVLAAASLSASVDAIKRAYESHDRGTVLTFSTGASSALRVQIEQGADADVFLSADAANPQALADEDLVDGTVEAFATNHLTIIVPSGNPAGITSARDLGRANVRILAAGEDVPITRYAEQVVAKLGALPGYPADFVAAYESNISSREDNVGAIVAKIALGEADAGIVYVTDARSAEVEAVEIPADANVTATYAGVVLKRAGYVGARDFLDWLRGADGQRILAEAGFLPAP